MNDFLKRAILREKAKCVDSEKNRILELAEKAIDFGFLSNCTLVSDNEFLAFEKKIGAERDDVRAVVFGLERLNNSDPYSKQPPFFLEYNENEERYG